MRRVVLPLFLLLMVGAGVIAWSVFAAHKGFENAVSLDFEKGTSTQRMAAQLEQAGVVRYAWQFVLVRALRPSAKLQAGEYHFTAAASPYQVFGRIARGDVFYYEVSVPEGSNLFDIAGIAASTGVISAQDFLKAAAQPGLIRDLDPKAATLEGYLFPSTYRITRRTTAEQLCKMMTEQFRREWKTVGGGGSAHDVVTLASLVEKETGVAAERPVVASVFANRLRIGMKLDCDPTTIYAAMLEDRYKGTIHRSDLASRNDYNTYQHAGLPPGPIANPGVASLKAAFSPAETDYIYFVAKPGGVGSHNFSATIAGHKRNVEAYRGGNKPAR